MVEKKEELMDTQKILNLMHMARKAGKLQLGFDACERACYSNSAKLLIVAADLAIKQKQKLMNLAEAYNVKHLEFASKKVFGREFKMRDIGVFCVEDANFASGINKNISRTIKAEK